MRYFEHEGVRPETAVEAIAETYTSTELGGLYRKYIGTKPPTRKGELALAMARFVEGDRLRATWDMLSAREKAQVAQTAWSEKGIFDKEKFKAAQGLVRREEDAEAEAEEDDKYESISLMGFGQERKPQDAAKRLAMDLVMPRGMISREVQVALRKFVPQPKAAVVEGLDAPPQTVEMRVNNWNSRTKAYERGTEAVPVVCREMERGAMQDLIAVLRLVDAGKLSVTEKNRWPTQGTIRQIEGVLEGGDFYAETEAHDEEKGDFEEEKAGPIRAFAWAMLLQAGKLAQARGSRLELTKAGRAALLAPAHETLRVLWQRWMKSDLLDELRRINVIKGQTGGGKRYLTKPPVRREAIEAALTECPVGRWVSLDQFSRFMLAAGQEFVVSSDAWSLYIVDQQYGSLGYEGYGGWNILQMRYLLCLFMEYAATLGLVDIAFIPPSGARPDYRDMWGTDELAFFSRYDGLLNMRLNGLGAYVLGLTDAYVPLPLEVRKVVRVEPDLRVVAIAPLSTADELLLETFAEKTGEGVWRIDPFRILDAHSSGRSADELIAFLRGASEREVPESVSFFIAEQARRAGALRELGPARLIGSSDPALLAFIARDPAAGRACSLVGGDKLVVADKQASEFARALRKLGLGIRTSG
jgi:hypothetical protein